MRGKKITPEQIERLKAAYAESGNISESARIAGLTRPTAQKYVRLSDEFDKARQEKREETIKDAAEQIAKAREMYLDHLMQPTVIATADAKDTATVIGILTDKHQLISGGATARTETTVKGETVRATLTQRLDELSARRQAKAQHEASATG
jgi:hypothetical protein